MNDKIDLQTIADEYLRAFSAEKLKTANHATDAETKHTPTWKKTSTISARERAQIAFEQLHKSEKLTSDLSQNTPVLDRYSWQDLDLLCGNESTPQKHMLARIDRTITQAGSCVLATELVNPSTDLDTIQVKQKTAQHLMQNEDLKDSIEKELNTIATDEAKRACLWKDQSPLNHPTYKKNLKGFFRLSWPLSRSKSITLWSYNPYSAGQLLFGKWLVDSLMLLFLLLPLFVVFYSLSMTSSFIGGTFASIAVTCFFMLVRFFIYLWPRLQTRRSTINFLAKWLSTWQSLVHSATKINSQIANNVALEAIYGKHLSATRALLAESKKDTKLGRVVNYLQTLPLQNWSYWWHHTGKLLVLHSLLKEHQEDFGDLIYEMGQIDVRLATATLVQEAQTANTRNQYAFPTVLETTAGTQPTITMEGLWHIGLNADKAVDNNLNMDATAGPRMIIITGPNTGGKSTYILGVAMNIVLSQALGVAAARSLTHHLFYKILTYVNPTQNLAQGLSLAEASFEVLKKHKRLRDTIQGPILMINDEILNGIDPEVAVEVGLEILEATYHNYPHCLMLLTTHYKPFTQLDRLAGVINKKVEVIIPGEIAPFDCTYKVVDGISTDDQNIVRATLTTKGVLQKLR